MASRGGGHSEPEEADLDTRARAICLALLGARARTRAELARALAGRGIADDVAAGVLDRYTEVGLIDDAAFADVYVRSARQQRGLGRKALDAELRRRGVTEDVARAAVAGVDNAAEEATARAVVQRRLRSMGGVDRLATVRRLVAMLGRKGYPEGMAWRVVREEAGIDAADPQEPWDLQ